MVSSNIQIKLTALNVKNRQMMHQMLVAVFLLMLTSIQPAVAYSEIANLNSKNTEELEEWGITITTLKKLGVDGPNWIKVVYDTSKRGRSQGASMVIYVIKNNRLVTAYRTEQKQEKTGKMMLTFIADTKDISKNSRMVIHLPEWNKNHRKGVIGDPGIGGFSLRLSRILELANQGMVKKTIKTEDP